MLIRGIFDDSVALFLLAQRRLPGPPGGAPLRRRADRQFPAGVRRGAGPGGVRISRPRPIGSADLRRIVDGRRQAACRDRIFRALRPRRNLDAGR